MGGSFPQSNRRTNTSGSQQMCVRTNQGNSIIRSMRLRCSSGLFKTGLIGYVACGGASSRVVEPQCRTRFNHVIRLQPVFLSIEQSNWLGFVDLRALGMGGPSWWLQIDNEWGCASLHFRSRWVSAFQNDGGQHYRVHAGQSCTYIHISGVCGYKYCRVVKP